MPMAYYVERPQNQLKPNLFYTSLLNCSIFMLQGPLSSRYIKLNFKISSLNVLGKDFLAKRMIPASTYQTPGNHFRFHL